MDSLVGYPGPCTYKQKAGFLFRHRPVAAWRRGRSDSARSSACRAAPSCRAPRTPRTCRRGSGTGLGRVNIGGHLTRWPNPSTQMFRFGRARLSPQSPCCSGGFWVCSSSSRPHGKPNAAGRWCGVKWHAAAAGRRVDRRGGERKPGKGNEEIESVCLLVGAPPVGSGQDFCTESYFGRGCVKLSRNTKLGVHSMMAFLAPRVHRAHRSSNSVDR